MNARTHDHALLLACVLCLSACAPEGRDPSSTVDETLTQHATAYDSTLAAELGADEYGMRTYVVAFLKAGPNRTQDSTEAVALQRAHLDNIQRMAAEGTLVLAGPFLDGGVVRGLYVFNVSSIEEARRLTETDPAIQAGRLEMELHPWYGSAALLRLNDIGSRITKSTP